MSRHKKHETQTLETSATPMETTMDTTQLETPANTQDTLNGTDGTTVPATNGESTDPALFPSVPTNTDVDPALFASNPQATDPFDVDPSLLPTNGGDNVDPDDDDMWAAAQEENEKQNPVGTFTLEILSATLGRSNSSGRRQITYKLQIVGSDKPKYIGVEIMKYDGMSSAKQTSITQRQLQKLGVNTAKLNFATLPAQLVDLKGLRVVAKCKQNDQFYNVNFIKLAADASATGIGGNTSV